MRSCATHTHAKGAATPPNTYTTEHTVFRVCVRVAVCLSRWRRAVLFIDAAAAVEYTHTAFTNTHRHTAFNKSSVNRVVAALWRPPSRQPVAAFVLIDTKLVRYRVHRVYMRRYCIMMVSQCHSFETTRRRPEECDALS